MAQITYEPEKNRLVVRTEGYEEGMAIKRLPSRRYLETKGIFIVPLTRMNAKMLLEAHERKEIRLDLCEASVIVVCKALAAPPKPSRVWPANFPFRVHPFPDQLKALHKCYPHDAFALFMRAGSGKSFVNIAMMDQFYKDGRIDTVVVICPLTVTTVWTGDNGQIAQYSVLDSFYSQDYYQAYNDKGKRRKPGLRWIAMGVESFSQGAAYDDIKRILDGQRFALLVDESHNIGNRQTIRTERIIDLGRPAQIRGVGTGTAAPKDLTNYYSQFDYLDPNIIGIGDYYAFRGRYCQMGGYKNKEITDYKNVDELMGLIEPYTYRCDKPAGLPPKLFTERVVTMAPAQKEMYRKVKNAEVEGVSVSIILSRIAKLQQVIGGFLKEDDKKVIDPETGRERRVQGKIVWELAPKDNPKIKNLLQWIGELPEGAQVVIWCKHLWEIRQLVAALNPATVGVIVGDTPTDNRREIIEWFQAGKIQYFIGTEQAGGIGITLTSAHFVFYYSNVWRWVDRSQSEDRNHRIGQKNDVLYADCLMEKSVDYLIQGCLKEHEDLDVWLAKKFDEVGAKALLEML